MDTTTTTTTSASTAPRYALPEFLLQRGDDSHMNLDQDETTTTSTIIMHANMNPAVGALFKTVSSAIDAQVAETITKLKQQIAQCEEKIVQVKRASVSRKNDIALNLTSLEETIAKTFSALSAEQTQFIVKVPTNNFAYSDSPISLETLRKSQPGVVEMLEETAQFMRMQGKVPSIFMDPPVSHHPNTGYGYQSDEHWTGGTHIVLKCNMAPSILPPRRRN